MSVHSQISAYTSHGHYILGLRELDTQGLIRCVHKCICGISGQENRHHGVGIVCFDTTTDSCQKNGVVVLKTIWRVSGKT